MGLLTPRCPCDRALHEESHSVTCRICGPRFRNSSAHDPAVISGSSRINPEFVGEGEGNTVIRIVKPETIHLDAKPKIFVMKQPTYLQS